MLAIPSPDVLLNLFASAAQMLGFLALMLGGGLFARRRAGLPGGAERPASRLPFRLCLGGLIAVTASFLLYHLQVVDANNQRLRTNLVRKSTEAQKAVGDTSLKTLSFSGQTVHPRGVSTEQLEQWMGERSDLVLVDVREPEEVEMGWLAGSWARRYPDLQVDGSGVGEAGKLTILLCESGNRSSELCDWFFKRGIETRFLVGGYEKWVAEYRPMAGRRADGSEIRATPDYPQKETLLDTPEVVELFTQQGALFVDVRYPEDFARDHLPDARNIPLRKMLAADADAALRALPARPIIAVCYDKRSSFYAQLLGLRLHRLGADFRGRYTVPHEFTLPAAEAEWVTRWKADRASESLWGRLSSAAGATVGWLADQVGLLLAVLLFVFGLRVVMLPFSLYAERDQWLQRRLSPRLAALKAKWAKDPAVWRRESMRLLKQARISPLRNLVGAMLQIVLFAAAFAGIDAAAAARPGVPAWFDLSVSDPTYVLPLLFGVTMVAFVRMQQQDKRRFVLPMAFVALVVALVWPCRAAVQLYLTVSIALMALQTVLQRGWLARRASAGEPSPAPRRLVPLQRAGRHPELGNKATRLGQLLEAGFPVPPGFAVPPGYQATAAELLAACRRAGIERAAVRSSAQGEDSAESSMAGAFLSLLDVEPAALPAAIERVRQSYGGLPGGVVVQAFRRADHAGVLFTVDPVHAGRMLVELVAGGGEELVSGRATPRAFRFGRASGRAVLAAVPPMELRQLIELGQRAERVFGKPQDIEWVHVGGAFQVVQSRDITRLPGAAVEFERRRVLQLLADAAADEAVLVQNEISELLPEPTAYSLALFESLWGLGGTVDRACRSTGFAYDVGGEDAPLVVSAFGRTFVDRREWQRRSRRGLGALATFRMTAAGQSIEDGWRAALPAQQARIAVLEAVDGRRLGEAELLRLAEEVRQHFVEQVYVHAETINLAAEFFVGAARRHAERSGHDAAALLRDESGTVVSRAFALLGEDRPASERVEAFVAAFGHRAPHDFEVADTRYAEDRPRVAAMVQKRPGAPRRVSAPTTGELPRVLQLAVERARRFQALKEEAKHEAMRELAVLRALLLQIGSRFGLGKKVFHLRPEEVLRLAEPGFVTVAAGLATARAERREQLLAVALPAELSAAALESLGDVTPATVAATGNLAGTFVAGSREVTGRVRVLRSAADIHAVEPGEIVVARCTDPCWLGAFAVAGGLVTEVGGWLSHAAIQAREQDLTTIVGVAGALDQLRTGEIVRLTRSGGIDRLPERRSTRRDRRAVDIRSTIRIGTERLPVRVHDLSEHGAGIEVANAADLPDVGFALELDGERVEAAVMWRNCTRLGIALHVREAARQRAASNRSA